MRLIDEECTIIQRGVSLFVLLKIIDRFFNRVNVTPEELSSPENYIEYLIILYISFE